MRRLLIAAAKRVAEGGDAPTVDGDLDYRGIRSAEKILEPGENWRVLGTDDDALVRETDRPTTHYRLLKRAVRTLRPRHNRIMDDAEDLWRRINVWYPDMAAFGDVSRAWQAEFDRPGIPLRVHGWGTGVGHRHSASIGDDDRYVSLVLSPWERQILVNLHAGDTHWPSQLEGHPPDLVTAAVAARLWLSRAPYGDLAAACPFFGSVALVEAKERGDEREHSWLELYENPTASKAVARLAPFVALAFHEPRLRAFRPYTSVWSLCFSNAPVWPFTGNHPVVTPVEQFPPVGGRLIPDGYVVHDMHGRRATETGAPGALALVLAELED